MNVPTLIGALVVLGVFVAIVARGIHNKRTGKGGCGGCSGDCGACHGGCHEEK